MTLDGVDVQDLDKDTLRRNIGIALQETVLFSGTVRDNIRYGRPDAPDEAVLADPEILILDEATSNVDTRTEKHLQEAPLQLMAGRNSFVIAHRLSTIRDADCLMVIQDGEIIERGAHERLLEKGGFYHHLYTSQFKGQVADAAPGLQPA